MIPEMLGHRVKVGTHTLPIIAWNDDGQPLVAGKHGLETAKWFAGRVTGRTDNYEVIAPPTPPRHQARPAAGDAFDRVLDAHDRWLRGDVE